MHDDRHGTIWTAMTAIALMSACGPAHGDNTVSITSTTTQSGSGGSSVSVNSSTTGGSGSADVRVVNGAVWIDGEKVPEDATRWTGRNGTVFRIRREGGQVQITSE